MISRRSFLRTIGIAAAGLPAAARILSASPSRMVDRDGFSHAGRLPVRVRGAVRIDGRGAGRIAVSDGLSVVATEPDGSFDLKSATGRPFCFVSVPAGVEIPLSSGGSAAHFRAVHPGADGEASIIFDFVRSSTSDQRHGFLVLADPQTLDLDDMKQFHETTVADVRETAATMSGVSLFGVGCGDLMFDRLELFPDYEKGITKTGVPFFQVLGNHDVDTLAKTDEASVWTFMKTFGPTWYSFNRGEVHYVVLDDVLWLGDGYVGYLTGEQLDWLRADLEMIERGRSVIVFVHIPVYCTQHIRSGGGRPDRSVVVANRELLYEILSPYRARIIAGHMHETEHLRDGGVDQHVCGAVCGAWWTGPICGDGTPNGYAVYEVNGESLRWRYKSTGKPFEEQMRVYPPGADASAPLEMIANIWDWDPSWKVTLYEDGIRKGTLRQVRGKDPLSVQLHQGPTLPTKHTWVEPYVTDHLFRAIPSPGAREVLVEAIDGFGRSYTRRLPGSSQH